MGPILHLPWTAQGHSTKTHQQLSPCYSVKYHYYYRYYHYVYNQNINKNSRIKHQVLSYNALQLQSTLISIE